MRAISFALFAVIFASGNALAAPSDLAGEWRAHAGKPNACGQNAGPGDVRFTLEFAVTGGQMFVDDGSEASQTFVVKSVKEKAGTLSLELGDGSSWKFQAGAKDTLLSDAPPDLYAEQKGLTFHRCRTAAERSAIKLSKDQIAAVSSAMPPSHFVFVDARAKGGCKALDYQYLTIDLVGPLGFTLGRWNSFHLAERLADHKKPPLPIDEVSNWTIDKADAVAGGTRFTVTEQIPPNGARGDTTVITLKQTSDGGASIAEWKRTYRRCSQSQLSAE